MNTHPQHITDPKHPDYNAAMRDAIMNLAPFYDPSHKGGVVREGLFHECLRELRARTNALRHEVLKLRTEVSCRTGHGAESNGHLEYVLTQLDVILANSVYETL